MSTNPFHVPPPSNDAAALPTPGNKKPVWVRINTLRRYLVNHLVTALAILSTVLVIVPLVAILVYLLYMGASSLNLAFFTHIPAPVGESGGGMANAIVGSGIVLALASLMGVPVGIAAGVYLAEFGRGKMLASAIRFTADVLNGVPSIVMGISIYSLIVMQQKHFSAFAGGVALAMIWCRRLRGRRKRCWRRCLTLFARRPWGWVCPNGARWFL